MSLTLSDFKIFNRWEPDVNGEKWNCCNRHRSEPKYLIDLSTNRKYFNESPMLLRKKCLQLFMVNPFLHTIASTINVVEKTLKLISFWHFRTGGNQGIKPAFKAGLANAAKDLLKIVVTPLAIIGLQFAALYGMIKPFDGRKLHASIERAIYSDNFTAPCFQPFAADHEFAQNFDTRHRNCYSKEEINATIPRQKPELYCRFQRIFKISKILAICS